MATKKTEKSSEEVKMISPKEYAEIVDARYQTVMLWIRQSLIPGVARFDLPTGGHYYLVPADAPKPQTKRGPKPKETAAAKPAKKGKRK